ncbi:hypothetical protein H0H81_009856 [Sphagnurus paluster]|uniref:Uncharacterized protein n=1 Tax=Sphagnurus paluster TaxID=117069 RepID=A0A9P7GPI8_9AGAR|nr:hypothetical protein H0H81_009856 [Sphagnurus paluster]
MGITGNPVLNLNFPQPEGIADFPPENRWRWRNPSESLHGLPLAPLPRGPPLQIPQHDFAAIKTSSVEYATEPHVLSPAAQLPTPASMAILLNPNSQSAANSPRVSYQAPLSTSTRDAQAQLHQPIIQLSSIGRDPSAQPNVMVALPVESLSREKKHGCTMCHKRHVRRCILKPVNAAAKQGSSPNVAPSEQGRDCSPSLSKALSSVSSPSSSLSSGSSENSSSPGGRHQAAPSPARTSRSVNAPKRRRRAPSPSRWIPPSLLSFNLSPPEAKKSTPVPLPPVRRNLPKEERDSWDENVASSPYHPRGWKNVLPGPGLGLGLGFGGKDLRNLNLGGNGGFMLGRVLVF